MNLKILGIVCFILIHVNESSAAPDGVPLGKFWTNSYLVYLFNRLRLILLFFILGILLDNQLYKEIEPIIRSTISYINNKIKYGRNKWFFYLNVLTKSDNHEIIRTGRSTPLDFKQTLAIVIMLLLLLLVCNHMEKGVLAIFAQTSSASSVSLKSFTNSYEMPFFSMSHPYHEVEKMPDLLSTDDDSSVSTVTKSLPENNDSEDDQDDDSTSPEPTKAPIDDKQQELNNFQLNMYPDMVPLLVSLIKYNRWKTIYYVYNYDEGK